LEFTTPEWNKAKSAKESVEREHIWLEIVLNKE